jgi:flagellar hook-associated protein 2
MPAMNITAASNNTPSATGTSNSTSASASASASASLTGDGTAASQATSTANTAANPLSKVTQRIQTEADSTKAQLSSFGLFKSAVSTLQLSAKTLSKLSATSTASELTTQAAGLFNTFNAAINAAQKATTGNALAAQGANSASRDLQRAVRADASLNDAMRELGLSVRSDGTMQHDAQKFAAAVRADPASVASALKKIGQQLDTVAGKELETTGKVHLAMSALSERGSALAAQQKALTAILQNSQTQMGLAAYLSNVNF